MIINFEEKRENSENRGEVYNKLRNLLNLRIRMIYLNFKLKRLNFLIEGWKEIYGSYLEFRVK